MAVEAPEPASYSAAMEDRLFDNGEVGSRLRDVAETECCLWPCGCGREASRS